MDLGKFFNKVTSFKPASTYVELNERQHRSLSRPASAKSNTYVNPLFTDNFSSRNFVNSSENFCQNVVHNQHEYNILNSSRAENFSHKPAYSQQVSSFSKPSANGTATMQCRSSLAGISQDKGPVNISTNPFENLQENIYQKQVANSTMNKVSPTSNSNLERYEADLLTSQLPVSRIVNHNQSDSGFTSPARSLSGGKSGKHFANSVDLLKSNFQALGKHAVSFERYQKPGNVAVFQNSLMAVTCRGREGCVNIFKIIQRSQSNIEGHQPPKLNNTTYLPKNTFQIRFQSSFKVVIDNRPVEPNGCKFDSHGNLFLCCGYKIAQISNVESIPENQERVFPDRVLGRECDLLYGLNFVHHGHIVVTDDARGAVSLINRDTGDKVFDYTEGLVYPLRKPKLLATTNEKDLIVTDDDKLIFIDAKQGNKVSTIFGGSNTKTSFRSTSSLSSKSSNSTSTSTTGYESISRTNSCATTYCRPTAIFCDHHNTLLVAIKERHQEKINYRYTNSVKSKLKLMTVNGSILCDDVLAEKSIQHVSTGDNGWEEIPSFIDMAVCQGKVYLLGDDKFVHCYSLVRV